MCTKLGISTGLLISTQIGRRVRLASFRCFEYWMMVAAVTSSKIKPIKSYSTADESIIALLAFPYISIVYPTVKALLFVASISLKKELGSSFQTVVEKAILS